MNQKLKYTLVFFFISFTSSQGWGAGFELIGKQVPLSVYIADQQAEVVTTATTLFFADMKLVTGISPVVGNSIKNSRLLIGTIGCDENFDKWLKQNGVSVEELAGQWEAFKIQVVQTEKDPVLIVTGSDSRGTAFGILEISRIIGVSPWYWWADVIPDQKKSLLLPENYVNVQKPSVQYRGIFINDEDWGLVPWSNNTFDPQQQTSLSKKTYGKIFELLLRLRANTLWPAMHGCSTPFYFIEGAEKLAAKYGIVIGTSHCEPLMRNTNGEWKHVGKGEYNYATNKEQVKTFWVDRLKEVSKYENIYTIGMRGVHDGKMDGAETIEEQTTLLTEIIKDQRNLLSEYLQKDERQIPQVFMPYKEVLDIYRNGMEIPEDVTLVWCDDNYGYITKLSDEKEQQRSGGAGVYYHISYFGKPHDYLWLNSTQPGLIYAEMKKAWDHGARKLWMLNVGDIKPAEYGIEFFLDFAWDIYCVNNKTVKQHLNQWLSREFGSEYTFSLSSVMNDYYHLAALRKPEFMGWSRTQEYTKTKRKGGFTDVSDTEFNPFMFGDELQKRINKYICMEKKVESLSEKLPGSKKDAYFQLVEYPVSASSAMNRKWLNAQKSRLFSGYSLPSANEYALLSRQAHDEIIALTNTYNKKISNGKWDGIMNMQPRNLPVFEAPVLPESIPLKEDAPSVVWVEGWESPAQPDVVVKLPDLASNDSSGVFISIFSKSGKKSKPEYKTKPVWLKITEQQMNMLYESRLILTVDKKYFSGNKTRNKTGKFSMLVDGKRYLFEIKVHKVPDDIKTESKRMVAWNAADHEDVGSVSVIQGLGHSMNAVLLTPGEELTYKIYTYSIGNAMLKTALVPVHAPTGGKLDIEVSIDNESPTTVSYDVQVGSEEWKENVLRGQSLKITPHYISGRGEHIIRIKSLSNSVLIDQFILDFEVDRKFYQIPVN